MASPKERITALLVLLFGVCVLAVFAIKESERPTDGLRDSIQPQWEWKGSSPSTFAIPALGSRTITWPNAPKGKARFTFTSSVPINFSVSNSSCQDLGMMLNSTIECEIEGGETTATLADSRTPREETARLGLGLFTRNRNIVNEITPATATFNAAFFVCVRNCPLPVPVKPHRQGDPIFLHPSE